MERINRPISIRIMYWITVLVFWLFVFTTILATGFTTATFFGLFKDLQLNVGIPVLADLKEIGTLDTDLSSVLVDVELKNMVGQIHFMETPVEIARVYTITMMVMFLVFLYILLSFKRFITNIYNGSYFDPRNINQLKRISYTLVLVWILTVFYGYFQYFFIVKNLEFKEIEFSGDVETYPVTLIIALIIWVLSHIFQQGSRLQEEQSLTV